MILIVFKIEKKKYILKKLLNEYINSPIYI
jgi:hypothetical protein